jgi:hypothetical protein
MTLLRIQVAMEEPLRRRSMCYADTLRHLCPTAEGVTV